MKTKTMLALLALGASALIANAQDAGGPPPDNGPPPQQQGPGGPGMRGRRPPPNLLFEALDTNHDGVIDANEIANAPAALKTLDKNGDGKITRDELRPPRPPRGDGPDGDRGPQGQGQGHPQPPPSDN